MTMIKYAFFLGHSWAGKNHRLVLSKVDSHVTENLRGGVKVYLTDVKKFVKVLAIHGLYVVEKVWILQLFCHLLQLVIFQSIWHEFYILAQRFILGNMKSQITVLFIFYVNIARVRIPFQKLLNLNRRCRFHHFFYL